jgi:hypothetical protein
MERVLLFFVITFQFINNCRFTPLIKGYNDIFVILEDKNLKIPTRWNCNTNFVQIFALIILQKK